jgi:hypothetical protein
VSRWVPRSTGRALREAPVINDDRKFLVAEYTHEHILLRGIPNQEDLDPDVDDLRPRVLDVLFQSPLRVCCWTTFLPLRLREATSGERAEVMRQASMADASSIFLLGNGVENYIICRSVRWAEYDIYGGVLSPLFGTDPEAEELHPPVGGVTYYWD